jgi:hypothetical protein
VLRAVGPVSEQSRTDLYVCRSIYAVRSAPQLIARAYPHIARRTYTWIPPGEVSRLGPERAEGRKSVALISTLFRGSFEVNIVIFLEVGRVAGLPEARDPIAPITFRPHRNFELALVGRHAFEKGSSTPNESTRCDIDPIAV